MTAARPPAVVVAASTAAAPLPVVAVKSPLAAALASVTAASPPAVPRSNAGKLATVEVSTAGKAVDDDDMNAPTSLPNCGRLDVRPVFVASCAVVVS